MNCAGIIEEEEKMSEITSVLMAISIGALAAVVYALRVIVKMDKKMDRLMEHQGLK